ncbi:MAG: IPT/TIG domain-containing protein, partial [Planctomycetota bacterium]|nr:IPT/TIG domain-containing protein [Planctomycetota bacterium]
MRGRTERDRLHVWAVGILSIVMAACSPSPGSAPKPRIDTITPISGDVAGGDTIGIVVRKFADDFTVNLPEVEFGGRPSPSISAISPDTLVATTPPSLAAGYVDVVVRGTGIAQSARLANGFKYTGISQGPIIIALSPLAGAVGTGVDVQGQGFSPTPMENVVRFNGIVAPIIASSTTNILTVVPGGTTSGPVNVEVLGVSSNDVWFTASGPRITVLSPNVAGYGVGVTITGENFSPNPSDNIVRFEGTLAAVTASTATTIDTNVPGGCITGPVTVEVAGLV